MNINKTMNWEKFTFYQENRVIDLGHLKRLKNSIQKHDLLPLNPIIVDKDLGVIDGQHRLQAAKELGLPIYYIVTDLASDDDVVTLQCSKSWTIQNALDRYVSKDYTDYQTLKNFVDTYELPISISIYLLRGGRIGSSNTGTTATAAKGPQVMKDFWAGSFRIKDYDGAVKIAERLFAIREYCSDGSWRSRQFIAALQKVYDVKVSHKKLMHKLSIYRDKLRRQVNYIGYLRQFEDVLNYKAVRRLSLLLN